ncbi:hypothetical protein WS67_16965 [Burkholderia singularis]|uniref:Uncharacterized protein n=1 Tax=Burkholderia singularis TaxID=1503053 RepID=A0A103E0H0_9BURK|nr:hypothetical protein WS67_16965 [Burkholderia singularis]
MRGVRHAAFARPGSKGRGGSRNGSAVAGSMLRNAKELTLDRQRSRAATAVQASNASIGRAGGRRAEDSRFRARSG